MAASDGSDAAGTRRRVERAWAALDHVHARRRRVVGGLAALAILAPLVLGAALMGGEARLSAYDQDWDDVGDYRDAVRGLGYDTANTLLTPLAVRGLDEPTRSLVVMAGVERALTTGEADALESFVREGGRLIVADDSGYANGLSTRFDVQFERTPLLDSEFAEGRDFVRANATLNGASYDLVLNKPSSLSNASRSAGTLMAESSPRSYQDNDRNGQVDLSDTPGPFPLMVEVPAGEGVVVFIADASILINEMASAGDNRPFLRDLTLHLLPDGGTVVFDESRHARGVATGAFAPAGAALRLAATPWAAGVLGAIALAITVAAAMRLTATPPWRHRHNPREAPLLPGDGDVVERARQVAAEAVASRAGVTVEALGAMAPAAVARAADDPVLAGFITERNKDISSQELSDILGRLRRFYG